MNKHKIALIHASKAAVDPVSRFFQAVVPVTEVVNLLDGGLMKLLAELDWPRVEVRLCELVESARREHAAELALLTCSAVPRTVMERIRLKSGIAVLKIDEPMAWAAVRQARKIGLLVTFPPTRETTRQLLTDAADLQGRTIELVEEEVAEALTRLLAGDVAGHDELLVEAAERLAAQRVGAIVLAQVSMARLAARIQERVQTPVFTSLTSGAEAVRRILDSQESGGKPEQPKD
jgi:Asp/Glu/hydantoin racemase